MDTTTNGNGKKSGFTPTTSTAVKTEPKKAEEPQSKSLTENYVLQQLGGFKAYQQALKNNGIDRKASYTIEEFNKLSGKENPNRQNSSATQQPASAGGSLATNLSSQRLVENVSQALQFRLKSERQIYDLEKLFNQIPTPELLVFADICESFVTVESVPEEQKLRDILASRGCLNLAQMNYKALLLMIQAIKSPQVQSDLDKTRIRYEISQEPDDFLDVDFFFVPETAPALMGTGETAALPAGV